MTRRRAPLIAAALATLAVGVGGPVGDVALKCHQSRVRVEAACGPAGSAAPGCPLATSEACVWGKSLLPLTIGAATLFLGLPAGWAAFRLAGWPSRRRGRSVEPA